MVYAHYRIIQCDVYFHTLQSLSRAINKPEITDKDPKIPSQPPPPYSY